MTTIDNATQPPPPDPAVAKAHGKLREAINQVIGSVFFGPMLRTARSSSLKGSFGHGGRGEEIFQGQLDQMMAERAGEATRFELADVLFNRFSTAAAHRSQNAK